MKTKDEEIEIRQQMRKELEEIQNYLAEKDIHVAQAEIVLAAIEITKRLGAGFWTFACEFRKEELQDV